jgi:demethylmenaquinone methyltransferase/2-methoxy-6-polyprenyl-1,4-benzoquinol methylase
MKPDLHFLRLLGRFHEVGLGDRTIKTFVGDVHAPFDDAIREALTAFIQMRWPDVQQELSKDDWTEFQRLSDPESADFILNLPDYYAFFIYSLFQGKVGNKE